MRLLFALLFLPHFAFAQGRMVVGSKIFTESYVLAEIAAEILEPFGPIDRKMGLGATGILVDSLQAHSVDVYPEYSGTLAEAVLKNPNLRSIEDIRTALLPLGLTISDALGFNNTYALAVTKDFAKKNGLRKMSDLRGVDVRGAFSYEFMDRTDGYTGMVKRYGFHFSPTQVARMDHSLVYQAIHENAVNVIEVYSTDANIKKFDLIVLEDDLHYFPSYEAVWVTRTEFVKSHPKEWEALRKIENSIDTTLMRQMNADADIEKQSFSSIASEFLGTKGKARESTFDQIWQHTKEHVSLVGISLVFSLLIGIPLGIWASRSQRMGQVILVFASVVQSIPSLALLCLFIPFLGIGLKPALAALCLYSLLPVVLNTFTGLRSIDPSHIENARAFGLTRFQILKEITLPLARPMILAGVKTATIVGVGTATLAALVGAGGYGTLIISGLSLNDTPTVLMGAIPAAFMALAVHLIFSFIQRDSKISA